MKGCCRQFEPEAIEEAMKHSRVVERQDRSFIVRKTRDLMVSDRRTERFATNSAAEQFEGMLFKAGQQVVGSAAHA